MIGSWWTACATIRLFNYKSIIRIQVFSLSYTLLLNPSIQRYLFVVFDTSSELIINDVTCMTIRLQVVPKKTRAKSKPSILSRSVLCCENQEKVNLIMYTSCKSSAAAVDHLLEDSCSSHLVR